MRISSSQTYVLGSNAINRQQTNLFGLQQQLSTMKRVNTPSDDPVAASRIVETRQTDNRNTQFISNTQAADASLALGEVSLGNFADILTELKTLAVAGGNGAYSDAELAKLGGEAKAKFEQLVSLANSVDGQGNYLFSGTKSTTTPYVIQGDGSVQYDGNDGQTELQISTSRRIAITDSGSSTFGGTSSAFSATTLNSSDGVFQAVQNLVGVLEAGRAGMAAGGGDYSAMLKDTMAGLDQGITKVVASQAALGSRMNETEALRNNGEDLGLVYKKTISDLEDLDYPKAASDLLFSKSALEASQMTFSKVMDMSLFKYI